MSLKDSSIYLHFRLFPGFGKPRAILKMTIYSRLGPQRPLARLAAEATPVEPASCPKN